MSKERILIVEDEALVAEELRENLENLGYLVVEVLSAGEKVVEAVAELKPDLILMDVRLEGEMDGIEAASQARTEFGVPVIYLSAYADLETLGRAAQTAPAAYLLKPFNERELEANVSMALSPARARRSSRESLRSNRPIVDALGLPALLLDTEGLVDHANEAALSLLKIPALSRLRGERLASFVDIGNNENPEQPRAVRAADGSASQAVVSVEPLASAEEGEIGALVVFQHMNEKERGLLESSAQAMNNAILESLPTPEAAGEGFGVGGFLIPCPSGSGDLFDVFLISPSRFCFFGLDVMGHGPLASLIAWSLRELIRQAAAEATLGTGGPAAILSAVNARYREKSFGPNSGFFSASLGLVDRGTGRYILGRAGHPPFVILEPGRSARILKLPGSAIGLSEHLDIEEISGYLQPGSRLLLPSDGLIEAFETKGGGLASLVEAAERLAGSRLADLSEAIKGTAAECFPEDDASLLVLERLG